MLRSSFKNYSASTIIDITDAEMSIFISSIDLLCIIIGAYEYCWMCLF